MLNALVVSPHRDDAAFSCAIAIAELSRNCTVRVANYFTASEYAPFRTFETGSVSELRLHEDQAFAKLIPLLLDDLELTDAPQRLSIHVSEISTVRPLSEQDAVPRGAITQHIVSLAPDVVILPLAVGDHIDHRIAQAAAIDTGIGSLAFYEDLPYCARVPEEDAQKRAHDLNLGLNPWLFQFPGARQWKRQCASLYPSQIDTNTINEIANFSNRYSEGERYWVTSAAASLFNTLMPE